MMPARELDPDLVQQKLERMQRTLAGLHRQQPVTAERLEADDDYAAIVERYLTQLVDLAVAVNAHIAATAGDTVPGDYQSTFDAAARAGAIDDELAPELRPPVGLRGVLVHAYETTDFDVVGRAAHEGATHYDAYVRQVNAFAARPRRLPGTDVSTTRAAVEEALRLQEESPGQFRESRVSCVSRRGATVRMRRGRSGHGRGHPR